MKAEIQSRTSAVPEANAVTGEADAHEADLLRKELAEQKNLNRGLAADCEKLKRRRRKEDEVRAAAQKESLILDLLPAIDGLERALAPDALPGSPPFDQGAETTLQLLREKVFRLTSVEVDV